MRDGNFKGALYVLWEHTASTGSRNACIGNISVTYDDLSGLTSDQNS